ncbi:NADH dehydrogenase subunit H [Nitrosococcus oceani ATCC 19707]|uniref:NADH dehydrogenase subunit H n=3 Tax=Nitrosococcus oceani TaxID=1229 RepID=Q3JDU8_NITOC|nr:NADH dehydrogenase subunit H [Nitrosococcus oceani ATCC 19707]KFI20574.1 NADH dehydrogenase [Nitrosococcus oceani C-27]
MGVMTSVLATVAALLAGVGLTAWLEPKWLGANGERGPASPVKIAADVRLTQPDPWLYYAGPVIACMGVSWAMVCIPFSPSLVGNDVNIGLFYFIVVVDFVVLGIALGGWGANTPDSVESCYRAIAQLIAYVIPLGLAIIGPIMMARSLSTVHIVEAQANAQLWYLIPQPIGFILYVISGLMQVYRAPFLEPFADPIGRGVLSVFGGWKGLLWRLALSGVLFVVAAMGAVIFLGGYSGPFLPGPVWMVIKTVGLMVLMIWLGRQVRLLSVAEMLSLSWKVLIPVGLLNVLLVGGLILLGAGQDPFSPGGGH